MRGILISIQPQWVEKILSGEKTIEIRKTAPKEHGYKVYIYCTKNEKQYFSNVKCCESLLMDSNSLGKVVAEFTLKTIDEYEFELWDDNTYESIGKVYYDIETGEREVDVFESDEDIEKTEFAKDSNLTRPQLRQYLGTGIRTCFAWHIDDLVVYDKPKELSEFTHNIPDYSNGVVMYSLKSEPLKRPPQSWCYVESICQTT